ncbi:MAG: hypothetical protein WCF18_06135 [Chthoniobacteraceae bacterium]
MINPLAEVPNPGDLKIEPGFKTAYYHDPDGDLFLLKTTKGAFSDGAGANPNTTFLVDANGIIGRIDLSFANFNALVKGVPVGSFQGASISATLLVPTKANGFPTTGDGRLNVGYVNATGVDLAGVTIPGDVTRIDAGDANDKTTGLGSFLVQSMGTLGLATQANLAGTDAAKLTSHIHGRFNLLRVIATGTAAHPIVHQGMQDVFIDVTSPDPDPKTGIDPKYGTIGTISIDAVKVTNATAAVLVGGVPSYTPGSVRASGAITAAAVGFSVAGGNSDYSGTIWSRTSIGSVTFAGKTLAVNAPAATLTGGAGLFSGAIIAGNPDTGAATAGKLGPVKVNKVGVVVGSGSIFGGAGVSSGSLYGGAGITSVLVAGDLKGGAVAFSGSIVSGPGVAPGVGVGLIGPVTIKGSLLGGVGVNSGAIQSAAGITSVLISHDQKGGTGDYSGSIVALGGNVTSITITGELDSAPTAARDKTGIFVDGTLSTVKIGAINPLSGPGVPTQYAAIVARGMLDKFGHVVPGTAIGTLTFGSPAVPANTRIVNYIDVAAGFDHVFDSSSVGLPGAKNNPDATIGTVTVNGGVFAFTVTAGTSWGANKISGPDIPIGPTPTTDDKPLPFSQSIGSPTAIAKIIITGAVTGGDPNNGDETVFEGAKLGTISVGGFTAPVNATQIQLFSHAYLLQIA